MTVGVLGGGQLGMMLAQAGQPLGMKFRFLDPDGACPAARVGELVVGGYDDEAALAEFVRGVDVVTYEFENVPARTARWLTERVPVFPPEGALATAQDRMAEKACFRELGIPTAVHNHVTTYETLWEAFEDMDAPLVVKTRRMGYDGKGQYVIRKEKDVRRAWTAIFGESPRRHQSLREALESVGQLFRRKPRHRGTDLIVERLVSFEREISMIGVRKRNGQIAFYPPTENVHIGGILSRSTAPAPRCDDAMRDALQTATRRVMERLEYVGVLAIEFFDLGGGKFVANEMAPRVHNSGHWTIEGAECSQFENHVRAVCDVPLGSTLARGHSVMLNVIGAEPNLDDLRTMSGVHVHMYGKAPRPGRKLGHVTVCAEDAQTVRTIADRAAAALRNC